MKTSIVFQTVDFPLVWSDRKMIFLDRIEELMVLEILLTGLSLELHLKSEENNSITNLNLHPSLLNDNLNESGWNSARPKVTYTWRIWLMEGDLNDVESNNWDGPIISPWKCAGTMKYIHLNCLKGWLDSKRQHRETPRVNSYFWK